MAQTNWQRSGAVPSPARYGFSDVERAETQLRAAGWWFDSGPLPEAEQVLGTLSRTPDPDLALHSVDRLRESLGENWTELAEQLLADRELRARLLAVLGYSGALADHLVAHPGDWRRLTGAEDGHRPRSGDFTAELLHSVGALAADEEPPDCPVAATRGTAAVSQLRAVYRGQLLEIAAADLAGVADPDMPQPSYEQVTAWLSDAAVAALRAAWAVAAAEIGGEQQAPRLAVIAMGKCGGRELNYVSDVDVVFVAESEQDLGAATRLASTLMRIAGAAFFEVDAALRPEGNAGALVRTLDGHLAYYRRWARTWEFQALLKARPVAGDSELGQRYAEAVQPLVWTAAERENFVIDVRSMRQKVEQHVPQDQLDRELKLGRGGLRDVEFAVQLLQLVHGRGDETIRSRSTTEALRALGEQGYVARSDAGGMSDSYAFLRGVEHRLQLRRLRRTHLFPPAEDRATLHRLARSMGLRSQGHQEASDVLLGEYRKQSSRVRRLHEKLFYRPLLESVSKVPSEALRLTTSAAVERLSALGYTSPDGALRHIAALTSGVSRRASIQGALLPVLLDLLGNTPDPDGGLLAYRNVSEALADTPWYLRLLRDEAVVVERLAVLLGTSKLVPELLVRAPEVLRLLSDVEELAGRDPDEVARSLRSAVSRHVDPDRAAATARSLRRHELLRIACADLLGAMSPRAVFDALSRVWVAVLQATLDAAVRDVAGRAEWSGSGGVVDAAREPARIAVIGMGRLGGAELGYGSDADVMFVCEPEEGVPDSTAVRFAAVVVEQVRRVLGKPSQDPPLEVDTDLRPEGRSGPLVRTLDSYLNYYRRWAQVWEAQALLRARPVAGDEELGERFCRAVDPIRYPEGGLDATRAREIRRIKARVDAERLPRGADPATHTKLGRGGLADVEWTLQLLQLRFAGDLPELRTTSTVEGLRVAVQEGVLDGEDGQLLEAAWTTAMRARNAVMLVRGKGSDQLPKRSGELAAVAAALGYPAGSDSGQVLDDYLRATRRARGVVERIFYEAPQR
ncbi:MULTISPECIES: bifunctional [glutamine synthetase] adenylyltransferase/[glutamine synthetase]-adenylyl-L-tyrosine phosphorylase [unclassified Actinopolyspora]|uniref:bifunctional [glutamine synthetase] adenylyltransferase/[glutamine synthetase]-adenylyl-L-tyrosine phosphorylase n=1 Tax=Actinopolyspora TaxID=1849 RepID=UPI0013F5C3B0|nr:MULTISPECIES: bifunctional [glutamine synthetase] adenylyltransferase/[glutamine synthetase]-adenylyl-L-tyrosine phosphorylase [unclassified Actinopolyspora]NHD17319.1 bifunctional [glutamine synthetase] adenylyltransferase/[glutamine synthetase]-adenylyl-L-tyrosine phosphorylase [Actinopolyspora sp. BKK2]NHE76948.1 bifunctional [glutamine synthetase] adenylyltransferase/[glutamine synthetase]-adenylyl-L-tyrosine phosphorylase [Actinopolyspora sp. BKK1]